ncbi:hypothetical protein MANES_16G049370v8 [Manihot esculenta]|uniref:Uncharacterized protein n=1 Tax=Manihot esculenta TaxID=3983 RepID=A0ACB7G5S8_MANES|nr:hypothetical protein MANES_16G049370v8 [Manihot esculenta]
MRWVSPLTRAQPVTTGCRSNVVRATARVGGLSHCGVSRESLGSRSPRESIAIVEVRSRLVHMMSDGEQQSCEWRDRHAQAHRASVVSHIFSPHGSVAGEGTSMPMILSLQASRWKRKSYTVVVSC